MKKLRLNKIFHWLYALLMFLPFILLFFLVIGSFGSMTSDNVSYVDVLNNSLASFIPSGFMGDTLLEPASNAIESAVASFIYPEEDGTNISYSIYYLFCYWIEISLAYLMFDVLMFIINVAHSWIDKGADKLC